MRRFVNQRGEFFGLRLARQQSDLAAIGDTQRRGNLFVEFQRDILLCEECNHPVAVLAHFASDVVLKLWEFCRGRLADILSRDLRPRFYAPM